MRWEDEWVELARNKDRDAVGRLCEAFHARLVPLARRYLAALPRQAEADPESVVNSAYGSFWRGLQEEQFTDFRDQGDLWKLLAALVVHKALDRVRRARALKRGGGRTVEDEVAGEVHQAVSPGPSPEVELEMKEELARLLDALDEGQRQVAALALHEAAPTREQMAGALGIGLRTIDRRLAEVRARWAQELSP